MKRYAGFAFLFAVVFLIQQTQAQDPTPPDTAAGLQPYQSYHGGDLDQVNLSNGNVHYRIPLISYPQRGNALKLNFVMEYDGKPVLVTKACDIDGSDCVTGWSKNTRPYGWRLVDEQDVTVLGHAVNYKVGTSTTSYSMATFRTPDGAYHPGAPITSVTGQSGQVSLDGSGFYYGYSDTGTCSSHCYASDSNGVSYYPSTGIKREDSNGNWIASASDGTMTDTMGRVIPPLPAVPTASNSNSNSGCTGPLPVVAVTTWSPPGLNGEALSYKFCYAAVTLSIPGGTNIADDGLSASPPVTLSNAAWIVKLQSIVLPNGQTWTFEYNSQNASDNCPTCNYGEPGCGHAAE